MLGWSREQCRRESNVSADAIRDLEAQRRKVSRTNIRKLVDNSGSAALCAIYWGGSTRSNSAGGKSGTQDVTIVRKSGLYVNNAAFASGNCKNKNTSYTPSANQATYLGSFHSSAAGQTEWVCHPAAASGGGAVDMAVYNTYSQHQFYCQNADSE